MLKLIWSRVATLAISARGKCHRRRWILGNPDAVRAEALSAVFEQRLTSGYAYREARPSRLTTVRGREKILGLVGERFRSRFLESRFVSEREAEERVTRRKNWVHFDRCTWVGVVYLNLPDQCLGGTAFYRHVPTGFDRWEQILATQPGIRPEDAFDGTDADQWLQIQLVDMVYNRLVLFDSRQFHQAVCYFGHTLENSRLCQHFAFEELSDRELLTMWLARPRL